MTEKNNGKSKMHARINLKSTLKSANVCYHSVSNISSFCLLSEKQRLRCTELKVFLCFYRTESQSLILREEHRLTAFENRLQRNIFVSKSEGSRRGISKCRDENFYSSSNIIRIIQSRRTRQVRHAPCRMEEKCTEGFSE